MCSSDLDFIKNGLERREKMKSLASYVGDKKHLRGLLEGRVKLEKVVKKEMQDAAQAILDDLSNVA